jgi:hypothetical protein
MDTIAAASDSDTPSDILGALADNDDALVRKGVALNPRTSTEVLVKLADDDAWFVRAATGRNRNTPIDILMRLAVDREALVRNAVAQNPNTPADVLAELGIDESHNIRRSAARNPNSPATLLELLTHDRARMVRIAVASNSNISRKLRYGLSQSQDPEAQREARSTRKDGWPSAPECPDSNGFYAILSRIKRKIKMRQEHSEISFGLCEERLEAVLDVVQDFRFATEGAIGFEDMDTPLWTHDSNLHYSFPLGPDASPGIDWELLNNAAQRYVRHDWMRDPFLDWAFLDALVYNELRSMRTTWVKGPASWGQPWLLWKLQMLAARGDIPRYLFILAVSSVIGKLTRFVAIPAFVILLYTGGSLGSAGWVAVIYGIWMLQHSLSSRNRTQEAEVALQQLRALSEVYFHCDPEIVSLEAVKMHIEKAIGRDVPFPPVLHALLSMLSTNGKYALFPFETSAGQRE